MKKIVAFAAVAALVLGACTKTETFTSQTEADAVSFGAYSGRTITKAGATDDMNLEALAGHGFGVFATYSGTNPFSAATNDFMYNQQVTATWNASTKTASNWTYAPIKYWPNPTDGSDKKDQKLSFFAYAPYCEPGTSETSGIMSFGVNAANHNIVNYGFISGSPNVDLLWGYKQGANLTDTDVDADVNINLTRTTETVKFAFRHMFSKLAGSQEGNPGANGENANGLIIKADPTVAPTNGFATDNGTKVTVSKITVKSADTDLDGNAITYPADGSVQTGVLDLYTGDFALTTTPAQPLKFEQTLVAGTPAAGEQQLAENLREVAGLTDFTAVKPGVTKNPQNVYADEVNPIILIPGTSPVVEVEVTYVVRTYDANINKNVNGAKHFSEVPQRVYGKIAFPTIEENKKYNICIIIGLMDVKFEATVDDWATGGPVDTNGDGVIDANDTVGTVNVYLPKNL